MEKCEKYVCSVMKLFNFKSEKMYINIVKKNYKTQFSKQSTLYFFNKQICTL